MTTISTICKNLFTTTTLSQLERLPSRGVRRNLARAIYRRARRPGLVNPVDEKLLPRSASDPSGMPERPGNPKSKTTRPAHKPMRHVHKLHEPPMPKRRLLMSAVKNLPVRV